MAEWLTYANQGAIRDKPLSPELVSALGSVLPDMGLSARVFSGGQDAHGPRRTGSTRHDHGHAGDMDIYMGDTRLVPSNPEHRAILATMVGRLKGAGVTGFGEGADYMGEGRMHIGFGAPAVWGAGGSSANAPAWLRAAYDGTPLGDTPPLSSVGGGGAGGSILGGGGGGAGLDPSMMQAMMGGPSAGLGDDDFMAGAIAADVAASAGANETDEQKQRRIEDALRVTNEINLQADARRQWALNVFADGGLPRIGETKV